MSVISAALLLFLVIDPIGNIPMFLVALRNVEPERRQQVIVRELLIALGVIALFLFTGRYLLELFQISQPSLSVAGGVVLFIIALRMIFPSREGWIADFPDKEPFIVPLAIPLLAGPSALATVMLMVTREPDRLAEWVFAVIAAWFAAAVILYFGATLSRFLGERGLLAIERLMGMLLTAVAVQMTLTGIRAFWMQSS